MSSSWVSLLVFVLCYVLFVVRPHWRSWTACAGGALLVAAGVLDWRVALFAKVSWNVIGLFFGTLILAEIFLLSRVPAVMAEWLVDKARSSRAAMLALCALAGVISIFVENVAAVLLVAPVALSLADKLKLRPAPLLIGIAICSNLQGTATMIGDPPSMILAGHMHLGFWDFFVYGGRPGIFFAVQVGAVASLAVLALIYRRHRGKNAVLRQERARSWMPAVLLGFLILGLSFATAVDPAFAWFAGVLTLVLGAIGLAWFHLHARWGRAPKLVAALDWDTTFFLIGIFVLVGGLSDSGWMDRLAVFIAQSVGGNVLLTFAAIVLFSVVVSGFVDNVPFLLMMLPVVQQVAGQVHAPPPLLLFGLLIGACLGGNLTPIGASANVVTLGILKKRGCPVRFGDFMAIGVPITAAAVTSACAFVWLFWRP
jgi:Na+/H+ antiporter NhaD/arsenite permease-like protein